MALNIGQEDMMPELFGDNLPHAEAHMKPCPFCGGTVKLKRGGAEGKLLSVICPENSICRGSRMHIGFLEDDIETAIAIWNTRWNGKTN